MSDRSVVVVGTGAWGVTLAAHAAALEAPTTLLTRTEAEATALTEAGASPRLPSVAFPPGLRITADKQQALEGAAVALLVVPSQTMRQNARMLRPFIGSQTVLVSASKGLEIGTALRMTEVIAEEIARPSQAIAALSGPNLAREVAAKKPSSTVVACRQEEAARRVQALLMAPHLRIYTHSDVIGVELGGALKNIVALGAGMADGLDAGNNAKASLMTRGLAEMARLGKAAGAEPLTFAGLAGLGDLIATCMSKLSRNRSVGEKVARGQSIEQIRQEMNEVAEGVSTTVAALELAARAGVEMPITELMDRVLFHGLSPWEAATTLMQRDPKQEFAGLF